MTGALASYLRDFSMADAGAVAAAGAVDLAAERAAAHAEGLEAAGALWSRRLEEERAALLSAHAAEMAALRQSYESEVAEKIAARFEEVAGRVAAAVADETARVLAPLLDEAVATKAVSDLAAVIREALRDGDGAVLTLYGPASLYEKLRQALGEAQAALRHVGADDVDISVDIGEGALVTRLSAWSASLGKVMA